MKVISKTPPPPSPADRRRALGIALAHLVLADMRRHPDRIGTAAVKTKRSTATPIRRPA